MESNWTELELGRQRKKKKLRGPVCLPAADVDENMVAIYVGCVACVTENHMEVMRQS